MSIEILVRSATANSRDAANVLRKSLLPQLVLETIFQFGADLGNFHPCAHQEFAAEEIMRTLFVGEFSDDAAILTVLIPAETPVRDGFRADVLKAAKNRILLGDLKSFPHNLDFDQSFVWSKNLRRPI
jgi:hypothetical protein